MKGRVSLSWTPERLEGGHEAGGVWVTVQSVESPLLGQPGSVFSTPFLCQVSSGTGMGLKGKNWEGGSV